MQRKVFVFFWFLGGLLLGLTIGFRLSQISFQGISLSYVGSGQEYFHQKDVSRAIAAFNKALAVDPDSFIAHISLADAYYAGNNFELALEEYETALQNEAKNEKKAPYIEARIAHLKSLLNPK